MKIIHVIKRKKQCCIGLLEANVFTDNNGVISFVRFKCKLFLRLNSFFLKLLDFTSKDSGSIDCRINTGGLDRNNNVSIILQKVVSVQCDNTGLIGLCNISKDNIDHRDKHTVLLRMTSIFDDRNNISSLLCHIDQITTGSVREFDSIHSTFRTNNISNMGNGSTRGSTEIKDLLARSNVNMVNTTKDGSSKLRSERIPYTVFNLCAIRSINRDTLFTINRFTGNKVLGN